MRISALISFVAILFLFSTTGCVKWYCCSYPSVDYTCVRPTDTVYLIITASSFNLTAIADDSLILYSSRGYTCTYTGAEPGYFYGPSECTRGTGEKNKAEKAGEVCNSSPDEGCFDGGDCVE